MAQYPNGQQAYYGQSTNAQAPAQPVAGRYESYSSQQNPAPNQHLPRRMPSYNAGDDSGFFNSAQAQNARVADGNAQYAAQSGYNAPQGVFDDDRDSRYSRTSSDAMSRMSPSRASSQTSTMSYQYQYSGTSTNQPAYNPQQYGLPHTQSQPVLAYNPLSYNGSNNVSYATPASGHQPYNPAAYQSANLSGLSSPVLPRRQSTASHYGQTPPTPQSYGFSSQQPPLPPPRGPDHPYGGRPSPYQAMSPIPSPSYVPSNSPGTMTMPPPSSRPYYGTQGSAYDSQSPQYNPSNTGASFGDLPPEPPVHQSQGNGLYGKRPSVSHAGAGRALPDPPMQPDLPQIPPRRTDTLTRHPQSRPLPGPPVDAETETDDNRLPSDPPVAYEDLMKEVEAAVDPQNFARRHSSRASHQSAGSRLRLSPDEQHTHTNGNMDTGTGNYVNYDAYSDESDAEAAAGLAMMQMADEEDRAREERGRERLEERMRRETNASVLSSRGSNISPRGPSPHPDPHQDQEFSGHDLALYEGGYSGNLHYGEEPAYTAEEYSDPADRLTGTSGSFRSSNVSPDERGEYYDEYEHPPIAYEYANRLHHLPPNPDARVDAGGTGGLSAPDAYGRRMSFDYGDEGESPYDQPHSAYQSDDESPHRAAHEDLFFHPGMRPLPPAPVEPAGNVDLVSHLMPAGTYNHHEQEELNSYAQYNNNASLPASADSYDDALLSPSQVPRSSSLSTPIGPRSDPPIRSKTDADRVRYRQQQHELMLQLGQKELPHIDPAEAAAAAVTLDLPSIPAGRRKRFHPAKLSSEQFKKCSEPWALSSILSWIRDLSEDETDLKEQAIADAIVALFTHKVPTMNIADAETLAARVVSGMLEGGALVKEEEWVKFGSGGLSGVLFQITGTGCYSAKLHLQEMHIEDTDSFGRCYSHHCMRTLKKVNLKAQMMAPQKKAEDWVTFYKVPKEVWESHPRKEVDRQNNLHEIVTTEDSYIGQLDVLRELYRDQLAGMNPSIIPTKRLPKFLLDVFGKVDAVKKVNEDFLLAQLKYRQKEQGPFITGFSDIFREWIRKAKTVYIDYAATFPTANYLVRKEAERNPHFKQFLNQVREHKLSNRLSWDTFLKAPITRIQRYTLLLATVHKNMVKDSEEKTNVAQAIEEIKIVALECDNKVGEMNKKANLMELAAKLQLRPDMKKEVELNLEHLGRQIIHRGDLQRPGTRTRFLVETHAILFDHYLVLAKTFTMRDRAVKYERYDVSKLPIPMDLLGLESTNDDPVVKSSVRGVSTVTPSQGVVSPLTHTGPASAGNTVVDNSRDDKILYPFKIKHLGKEGTYTLYAYSAKNRMEWCQKIIEAKTKHAAALFSQNAEPFRLRVLADTAFAYSDQSPGSKSVTITGTPLHRAIKEVEKQYEGSGPRPTPVCRTSVTCATVFQQPPGRIMCAIGTEYGVYMSELNNPRGWYRAIPIMRVTQVAVFEEFNLLLLIADRSLIAYHLDVVCPASGSTSQSSQDSARRAPQKLSGNREVGFFAAGRLKDRYLVLYKKRDGLSSTFKVLEPVLQKSATNKSRLFTSRRSQTEFFREYDEFYIPAETYRINMFHSSLAISTQKGIEVLTLDKKHSWSVPDFRTNEVSDAQDTLHSIANRIRDLKPLGMFRLSDSEFLVAYQECAVYVNKHGDVSRSVVMEFVGCAHTACLYGRFLILFNDDFVEVRNAMNGRLRQVIPGRNVVCLDDGSKMPGSLDGNAQASSGGSMRMGSGFSGATNGVSSGSVGNTVKICMQHPEYERSQLVLELVENEGQKD
ncbi:uncharacterized protein N7446_009546 [Penicillium canescens]|uniref:Uncharacterized protein n=1 Tax=Penicillium canescens TaxID=5083 RepID=A0AAD6N6Q2_PENCN|nr:uncharacterized protein N7446_009546 [Penicillium canescens]KAJ6034792.1 hypothetical protein N7460_008967 [Penicillium canescens]KAJ6046455.1 hypothetical protein N7444_007709 [Penicillium canescens]KAJ6053534.1 hypothetical protein N7446_009546 [Penicillium canescens]